MKNYFTHTGLDLFGYIEKEDTDNSGVFRYMDSQSCLIESLLILDLTDLKANPLESVKEMSINDFTMDEIKSFSKILVPAYKSIVEYDLRLALSLVVQEGIKRQIFFTDLDNSDFMFGDNGFEAIVKSNCFFYFK